MYASLHNMVCFCLFLKYKYNWKFAVFFFLLLFDIVFMRFIHDSIVFVHSHFCIVFYCMNISTLSIFLLIDIGLFPFLGYYKRLLSILLYICPDALKYVTFSGYNIIKNGLAKSCICVS